ncbi:uracil-DNA glycosylase family protein [Ruegeria sp. 2205SS24-7]|uniref:uracil-DNA glycosylase family protein n=1 Tax=Ruegeria discodermiae TaxID=3064389 RepID=UPI0027426E2F|nr:uracil-DNA glycosylase family protein [Ruegeria sp. 2205SS24-7]MDP5220260.1 uracil-DNA glycosylase family protein [Ruegeria sp. 2205SS24-7]
MSDFETLKTKMRACALCTDLPLGPNPLFQLSDKARILIVGQAPGRITHSKGRPFDDPSGDRLRNWLAIDKDRFYSDPKVGIFPMGLCFPGGGAGGDKPPRKICATTWRAPVLSALQDVRLTLILGAYAIAWHAPSLRGLSVADAVRRSGERDDGNFILPHPSPRNNRWLKNNPWFEADIVPRIQRSVYSLLSS